MMRPNRRNTPDADTVRDGITEQLPRAFEMPEARHEFSFRTRTRDDDANPRRRPKNSNRGYIIATVIAVCAILVAVAWGIDSARYGSSSAVVANVAATANKPVKAAKHKKRPKKVKASRKRSHSTAQAPTKTTAVKTASATQPAPASTKTASAATPARMAFASTASSASSRVVVIDAGHQGQGDSSLEPIGPGAATEKPKVASGASGQFAPHDESQINLAVALKLRDELESRGVHVIMVRTSQNVNIANSARAQIANKAHAALFIRLHCDGVSNTSLHGFSTLVPAKNQWTGPILAESTKAGRIVQAAALKATGAADRGIVDRGDLSGFNWSQVPTVLVEMGFMSNSAEDKALTTSAYQRKLATGLANGVVGYLGKS